MITTRWRVALFLFVAAGLNYADRTALSSVIPPLRADIGITDAQIGFAGMLFLWCYALASPFAGNLADRFSRSKIVVWSLVAWSLVTIFTGLIESVIALFVMRIALGIAESFYLPAAGALLGDHHGSATRGRAMGFHMLGLNLGLVLGGSAAGLMAEHFGWRLGFWVLGGLGLLLALTSRLFLSDGPAVTTSVSKTTRSVAKEAWLYLLKVPSFHCLLLSAMVAGVAAWIFLSWLPLFFAENYGMKLGAAGLAGVALYKGPVFVGIAIGGWLSDTWIRRDVRARALIKGLSFIVSAPFLFFFMGSPTFTVVAIMMVLSSIIRAIGLPSEHPIICEVVPTRYRSTAIGILNTCGSAAGGLGVLLAGVFKKDLGLNMIFGASSFLYVLAGLMMLLAYWIFMGRDMARSESVEKVHTTAPAT
ncbi:MAG TPA: MFS transporter [Opitutaceae bacterium]|nr:MFS transporter [Opitutaceae bacterium]